MTAPAPSSSLVAAPARPGKWLDASVVLSDAVLDEAVSWGAQGIVRTLALPGLGPQLLADEANRICAKGLQLGAYQRVRLPGWSPVAHDPKFDVLTAITQARAAGLPFGMTLWCDWEGVDSNCTEEQAAVWLNGYSAGIVAGNFRAGLYIGYDHILSPAQLYGLPSFHIYAIAPGQVPPIACGASWVQGSAIKLGGVEFDTGVYRPDLLGRLPIVAQSSPGSLASS